MSVTNHPPTGFPHVDDSLRLNIIQGFENINDLYEGHISVRECDAFTRARNSITRAVDDFTRYTILNRGINNAVRTAGNQRVNTIIAQMGTSSNATRNRWIPQR